MDVEQIENNVKECMNKYVEEGGEIHDFYKFYNKLKDEMTIMEMTIVIKIMCEKYPDLTADECNKVIISTTNVLESIIYIIENNPEIVAKDVNISTHVRKILTTNVDTDGNVIVLI